MVNIPPRYGDDWGMPNMGDSAQPARQLQVGTSFVRVACGAQFSLALDNSGQVPGNVLIFIGFSNEVMSAKGKIYPSIPRE